MHHTEVLLGVNEISNVLLKLEQGENKYLMDVCYDYFLQTFTKLKERRRDAKISSHELIPINQTKLHSLLSGEKSKSHHQSRPWPEVCGFGQP